MLSEAQVKKLVVRKIYRLQGCRDRETIMKNIHLIRGMLVVMLGRDPGDLDSVPDILDAMEVPYYRDHKNQYFIEQDWLDANGIET